MQKQSARFGLVAAAAFAGLVCGMAPASAQSFTDWGWPQPYEKVSDKSIAWLKQKGWWPLGFGWQGPFSGQNTINVVMDKAGLLEKRGLEGKFQVFAAGPDVNEAVASARIQVGNGGNFPFTSLLDRGVPVRAIAVVAPNLKHSTVVPVDLPIKQLADFKGSNPPATIGIVTGSSAEFYFTQAAEVVGLQIGKDVILKNMPPAEQLLMAKGIGAVVPWEPPKATLRSRSGQFALRNKNTRDRERGRRRHGGPFYDRDLSARHRVSRRLFTSRRGDRRAGAAVAR